MMNPQELAGIRFIAAAIDGETVAIIGFVMQPDVLVITPKHGSVGTDIEIGLYGSG